MLDNSFSAQVLSDAGSCALGAFTLMYMQSQGMHYETYSKLYESTVTS